jgi:hypothetical protein
VIAACGNVEDSFEWEILGNLSVVTCGGWFMSWFSEERWSIIDDWREFVLGHCHKHGEMLIWTVTVFGETSKDCRQSWFIWQFLKTRDSTDL